MKKYKKNSENSSTLKEPFRNFVERLNYRDELERLESFFLKL